MNRLTLLGFIIFVWQFDQSLQGGTELQQESCNLARLEGKIQQTEKKLLDEINILRSDLRERIRGLEYQSRGIRNSVENYKKEFQRTVVPERSTRVHEKNLRSQRDVSVDEKLDNVLNLVKLTTATVRLLDYEFSGIKRNLSQILNVTNEILDNISVKSTIDTLFTPSSSTTESASKYAPNCAVLKEVSDKPLPSGIYQIQPDGTDTPFMVYCELETQEGGWVTIQNRYQGSQDFSMNWADYKLGFGNLAGEHWLGLEKLHQLTGNQLNELLIELIDNDKSKTFAHYSLFSVGSEEEGYAIKILGAYQGDAGDSLSYHAGAKFSTIDSDQDNWIEGSCAQTHGGGGWWFKSCDKANLNGKYFPGDLPDYLMYQAMYWGQFRGPQVGLRQARMLIRPVQSIKQSIKSPQVA